LRKIEDVNWLKNGRHIRIWQTKYTTLDGNNIYLGMTNSDNGFKWGVIPAINPDLDTERERLYSDF
jgi:undecaprenyl-diphosphatase